MRRQLFLNDVRHQALRDMGEGASKAFPGLVILGIFSVIGGWYLFHWVQCVVNAYTPATRAGGPLY